MSWIIPTAMAYSAVGYLGLLWYSDYLLRKEKASSKKTTSLTSAYINAGTIKGTAKERVDTYLERCQNLLRRVGQEAELSGKVIQSDSTYAEKTMFTTTRPASHYVIKKPYELIEIEEKSDFKSVLRMEFNKHRTTRVKPSTSFEYAREYFDGLVRVKEPLELMWNCWKLVSPNDQELLNYCLDESSRLEDLLKMEMHKRHSE